MALLTQRDLRAFLEVLEIIHGVLDSQVFPARVLSALCTLVSCEVGAFIIVDCLEQRLVMCAQEPAELTFPGMEEIFERHLQEHPLFLHFERTRESSALKMSDFLTLPRFRSLGLYRQFYGRLGMNYQLGIGLPATPPFAVWVELNRSSRDFSERDRTMLNLLRPHLMQAMRNVEAIADLRERRVLLARAAAELDVGLLVLTPGLDVRRTTPRAEQLLEAYFADWAANGPTLPEPITDWIRQQQASREIDNGLTCEPLIVEGQSTCLVIRLLPGAGQTLLLVEETVRPHRPTSLEAFGLTPREVDVLVLLSQGKSNTQIGEALQTSTRTVGKHLEHVYAKLGVDTRAAAVVRALALLGSDPS